MIMIRFVDWLFMITFVVAYPIHLVQILVFVGFVEEDDSLSRDYESILDEQVKRDRLLMKDTALLLGALAYL
jgi:hypothetical protein